MSEVQLLLTALSLLSANDSSLNVQTE